MSAAGSTTGASPDERYALVVDLGTGGPKVGLCSLTGTVAWQEHHAVETHRHDDGGATQDAGEWWRLICDATRRALADGAVPADRVVAVSITGQWASTVPVDATGEPVGECLLWMDTRGGPAVRKAVGGPIEGYHPIKLAEFIRRSGGAPSLAGSDPIGQQFALREQLPDVWNAARWLLEPVDYLSMRFTGVAAASAASMAGVWMCDTRDPAVCAYDPKLAALGEMDLAKHAPLRPFGTVIAPISAAVADDLGLSRLVAVVTGCPDLHSSTVGSGAVGDREAHLAVSTSGWIGAPVLKKKTDIFRSIATVPGLDPSHYLVANNHETSGLAFAWLKSILVSPDADDLSFAALGDLAGASAPGSGGAIFTPWLNGERSPVADSRARAAFHNLSSSTTRADMARAVLEGVALNNLWLLDACDKFVGETLDPIRMIGGGAQSDLWCQIHADVLGRTIEQVADPLFVGMRGAALIAAMALGEVKATEVRALVPVRETYRPHADAVEAHRGAVAEFPKLYAMQKKMFHRLNRHE